MWSCKIPLRDQPIYKEFKTSNELKYRYFDNVDYNFDEENYRLVGEQHGRVFRLGEPVRVRVRNAEPANRTIDFTYVEKETETE